MYENDKQDRAAGMLEYEIDGAAEGNTSSRSNITDAIDLIVCAAVERAKAESRAELDGVRRRLDTLNGIQGRLDTMARAVNALLARTSSVLPDPAPEPAPEPAPPAPMWEVRMNIHDHHGDSVERDIFIGRYGSQNVASDVTVLLNRTCVHTFKYVQVPA